MEEKGSDGENSLAKGPGRSLHKTEDLELGLQERIYKVLMKVKMLDAYKFERVRRAIMSLETPPLPSLRS